MIRLLFLFGLGFKGLLKLGLLLLTIVAIAYSVMNGFSLASGGIIVVCLWLSWKVFRKKRLVSL